MSSLTARSWGRVPSEWVFTLTHLLLLWSGHQLCLFCCFQRKSALVCHDHATQHQRVHALLLVDAFPVCCVNSLFINLVLKTFLYGKDINRTGNRTLVTMYFMGKTKFYIKWWDHPICGVTVSSHCLVHLMLNAGERHGCCGWGTKSSIPTP